MAGTISPGQKLTPNPNVNAPAGFGNGIWGANGGGITPVGGGATDQTGYVKPIAITPSDGETAINYIPTPRTNTRTVTGQESVALLSGQTQDSALAAGGSNAG
jgi:hypothetical protein